MSIDAHKSLVTGYIERVWNGGDADAVEDLTTPAFAYRLGGQAPLDRAGMRQFLAATRVAFPDWRVEIASMLAERDSVAVRWVGTVTHRGAFHGIPPTGRTISVSGINLYRIENSKIAEEWEETDSLGMLRQLGVLVR